MLNHKVSASFSYDPHSTCCMIHFCNTYPLDLRHADNVLLHIVYNSDPCTLCTIPCCNIVVESISKFCIDSQCLILSGELITVYVLWFLTMLIHVTSLIVHNFLVLGILGKYTLIYFALAFICVVSGLNKHWFGVFLMFIKWGLGIKLIKH